MPGRVPRGVNAPRNSGCFRDQAKEPGNFHGFVRGMLTIGALIPTEMKENGLKFIVMKVLSLIFAVGAVTSIAFAGDATNVALGKTVTPTGVFGVMGPGSIWPAGTFAPYSSVTDGNFLSEGSVWQTNTVWWNSFATGSANNFLLIDLAGSYDLESVALQGDDNEIYVVEFYNASSGFLGQSVATVAGGGGMRTRTVTAAFSGVSSLRVRASGGDGYYSVSEVQALGQPVPEPATMLVLGSGLLALARRSNRRQA